MYVILGNEQRLTEGLKKVPGIKVNLKGDQGLKDLHYNDNPRIAPIILEPREGLYIVTNKSKGHTLKSKHC